MLTEIRIRIHALKLAGDLAQLAERWDYASMLYRRGSVMAIDHGYLIEGDTLAYLAECCDDTSVTRNEINWEKSAGVEQVIGLAVKRANMRTGYFDTPGMRKGIAHQMAEMRKVFGLKGNL